MSSQTLAHGNTRMKEDREREEDKNRCVSMERSKVGTKKMKSQRPKLSSGISSPGVDEFPT